MLNQGSKLFQTLAGFRKNFFGTREVKADQMVDRLMKKTGAGHGGHAHLLGHPVAEMVIIRNTEFRAVHHDLIGALGFGIGQAGVIQIA